MRTNHGRKTKTYMMCLGQRRCKWVGSCYAGEKIDTNAKNQVKGPIRVAVCVCELSQLRGANKT